MDYNLLKHVVGGPKLEKNAPEYDGKRFGLRNLFRPLLVIMRRRGNILDGDLRNLLRQLGQEVPMQDKVISR